MLSCRLFDKPKDQVGFFLLEKMISIKFPKLNINAVLHVFGLLSFFSFFGILLNLGHDHRAARDSAVCFFNFFSALLLMDYQQTIYNKSNKTFPFNQEIYDKIIKTCKLFKVNGSSLLSEENDDFLRKELKKIHMQIKYRIGATYREEHKINSQKYEM